MSWQALAAVSDRMLGSAPRKAVIICLANHANIDSELTFPSVRRIAGETELAESTVRECLGWLRAHDLIIQVKGPAQHRPATYRLNYAAFSALQQVEVWRNRGSDLQQAASDLQDVAASEASPPPSSARPPGPGPEPKVTVRGQREPKGTDGAFTGPASKDQTLWVQTLVVLQRSLSRGDYDTWVRDTEVTAQQQINGTLVLNILVGNDYAARHLVEMGIDERAAAIASKIADKPVRVEFGTLRLT